MFTSTIWALRLFGLSGVLGAVLFITGDLLYNHVPGSKNSPTVKMSRLADSRLINAGTLGLIGCWFYTLASFHIFMAFRPAGEWFAFMLALAIAAVMICYGITHAAYFSIAAGAKFAGETGSDVESGGALGNSFYKRLVTITYIPVAISSLMMLYGIIARKSLYPFWMAAFLPVIIYLLRPLIIGILNGRIKELINDSYDNVILLVFYLLSTLVLWSSSIS